MTLSARILFLKIAAGALLIGPGLLMILAPVTPTLGLVERFLDLAHQPLDGAQAIAGDAAFLLNAILGGVLVGFGLMIWLAAERVYRNDPALGRSLILIPLFGWFISDSLGSVIAGAWFNTVLNTAILAIFIAPLAAPSRNAQATQS